MSEKVIVGRVPPNMDPHSVRDMLELLASQHYGPRDSGIRFTVESVKTKK